MINKGNSQSWIPLLWYIVYTFRCKGENCITIKSQIAILGVVCNLVSPVTTNRVTIQITIILADCIWNR